LEKPRLAAEGSVTLIPKPENEIIENTANSVETFCFGGFFGL
jgi:hypothetical protein